MAGWSSGREAGVSTAYDRSAPNTTNAILPPLSRQPQLRLSIRQNPVGFISVMMNGLCCYADPNLGGTAPKLWAVDARTGFDFIFRVVRRLREEEGFVHFRLAAASGSQAG